MLDHDRCYIAQERSVYRIGVWVFIYALRSFDEGCDDVLGGHQLPADLELGVDRTQIACWGHHDLMCANGQQSTRTLSLVRDDDC